MLTKVTVTHAQIREWIISKNVEYFYYHSWQKEINKKITKEKIKREMWCAEKLYSLKQRKQEIKAASSFKILNFRKSTIHTHTHGRVKKLLKTWFDLESAGLVFAHECLSETG